MRKFTFCLLLGSLMLANTLLAQNLNVGGVVVDKKTGEPLIGATVIQKGTSNGTVTDLDGKFALAMPKGTTLLISYVGYINQEQAIDSNEQLRIFMVSNVENLEEVVVVGYGTSRKRDLTGSIVSISGESLKSAPNYNPVNALQGKVPGLLITNNGSAGGSPRVLLRGVGTMKAGSNPLFVVDGLFTDNIDFINPNDITSIEVLKDPSSLAIFGVQGANGVIIITTKRAEKGKLSVSYDGYVGTQILSNQDRVKLTNASEFTLLYNEQLKNANPAATDWVPDLLGGGTNWQSYIFRPAMITNHSITIGNSTDKANNVFSLGYFKQDGIVKYNDYQRFNGRWSGDYIISKNLKMGGNVNLSRWDASPASASVINAVQALPTYSPYSPVADHNPNNIASYYTPNPSIQKDVPNPVAVTEINKGNTKNYGYRVVGNVFAEITFLKDFTLKATGYGDIGINLGSVYIPQYNINNATSSSSYKNDYTSFSRNEAEYTKYQADFILNYNKKIELHKINALVGYTARIQKSLGFSATADSLESTPHPYIIPVDLQMLSQGNPKFAGAGNTDTYDAESFISYLGRVNYSYSDKYLASVTFRIDGSSKFSPSHRWGYFPSVGLGWVITEEDFISGMKDVLNYMKIKTSWGMLGNDKIGSFLNYPRIYPKGQQVTVNGTTYYLPTFDFLVDQNMHWEVVSGLDAGFESQFFNSRLSLDLGYFTKTTKDLLATVIPSNSVGAGYAVTNAGSLKNSGVEFILSWHDKIGKFSYGASVNGATLKNEVLSLGNDNADVVSDAYHVTSVGHPVGALYGYVQDGIFQNQTEITNYYPAPWVSKPGDIRFKDLDGDKKITSKDRTFIGSIIPTFTYGFTVNAGYQNFDLSVDLNGVYGNQIVNTKKLSSFTQFNFYTTALNRWHGEGTSNFEPILDLTRSQNFQPSTNLLESGAYLRIRSIQLGYNLPNKILKGIGITKFRVFANSQNPFTFKKNTGYTPEIGGELLTGGVDNGSTYPIPSTFTAGLSVNF